MLAGALSGRTVAVVGGTLRVKRSCFSSASFTEPDVHIVYVAGCQTGGEYPSPNISVGPPMGHHLLPYLYSPGLYGGPLGVGGGPCLGSLYHPGLLFNQLALTHPALYAHHKALSSHRFSPYTVPAPPPVLGAAGLSAFEPPNPQPNPPDTPPPPQSPPRINPPNSQLKNIEKMVNGLEVKTPDLLSHVKVEEKWMCPFKTCK